MERWMIVYVLPIEVWMDIFVFPWISREEFGKMVAIIGNFKFAEHAQFYLHEWGKRKLGDLRFDKDGLCKYIILDGKRDRLELEYPQTSMPENIKSFNSISIKHFDANTLDFLTKIKPLLTDVEIDVGYIQPSHRENLHKNLHTILAILAPMLDRIHSVYCEDVSTLPLVKNQLFQDTKKLAKLKWLLFIYHYATEIQTEQQQEMVEFIMNWLAQSDGPTLLDFGSENDFFMQILKAIREEFLSAATPRPFAVDMKLYSNEEEEVDEFHLSNAIGEELHGEWIEYGEDEEIFEITRHQANCNTDQEREWIEEMTKETRYPSIRINEPTIGSLDAVAQVDVQPMDGEKQAEQQPCSSKVD